MKCIVHASNGIVSLLWCVKATPECVQCMTDCVARTLEHDYGGKIIHALSQSKLVSSSEIHKMQWCENKLPSVAARQQDQLDLLMTKFKNIIRFFWHADKNLIQARVL